MVKSVVRIISFSVKVVDSHAKTLMTEILENIEIGSIIYSDNWALTRQMNYQMPIFCINLL